MDDSYDFGAARVPARDFAHRNQTVLYSNSLLQRLLAPAPDAESALVRAAPPACADDAGVEPCAGWAAKGECEKNPSFMHQSCRKACHKC